MVGVGITPEGINQNYAMYDFALSRAWNQNPTNVTKWINEYTFSRYGIQNEHIATAWKILKVKMREIHDVIESKMFIYTKCHLKLHFLSKGHRLFIQWAIKSWKIYCMSTTVNKSFTLRMYHIQLNRV